MKHEHTDDCIIQDVIDMGDDGDGYVAYPTYECNVTGEYHRRLNDFLKEAA